MNKLNNETTYYIVVKNCFFLVKQYAIQENLQYRNKIGSNRDFLVKEILFYHN